MTCGYSTITPDQSKREIRDMHTYVRKKLSSPDKARKFLIRAGILDKSGKKLAKAYR